MSEIEAGYGYVDDESQIDSGSALVFGLNPGIIMTKFEYITNGGKDGAEQEALDIVFNINGTDRGNRLFPIVKAFGKDNEEITDPKDPAFQQAFKDLNAIISHIMHCYVPKDSLITALSVPMQGFKDYCTILMGLLPSNYHEIKLDAFAQYQWQIKGEATRTYLQLPSKMKYGKWLVPSVPAQNEDGSVGSWKEFRKTDPSDGDPNALYYQDGAGNIHPFTRNGWFVNSNFATQQKADDDTPPPPAGMAAPTAEGGAPTASAKGWS